MAGGDQGQGKVGSFVFGMRGGGERAVRLFSNLKTALLKSGNNSVSYYRDQYLKTTDYHADPLRLTLENLNDIITLIKTAK